MSKRDLAIRVFVSAGMHLARNHADPDYRARGAFGGPHVVAFTSEHAHYSYLKAAFLTGTAAPQLQLCIEGYSPFASTETVNRIVWHRTVFGSLCWVPTLQLTRSRSSQCSLGETLRYSASSSAWQLSTLKRYCECQEVPYAACCLATPLTGSSAHGSALARISFRPPCTQMTG